MSAFAEKHYRIVKNLIAAAAVIAAFYLVIQYLMPFFAPFILAVILVFIDEPVVTFLEKKARIPRKLAAFISLFMTISVLGGLLTLITVKIYTELVILKGNVSDYITGASNTLTNYIDQLTVYYNNLPVNVTNIVDENLKSLVPRLENLAKSVINYSIDAIKSIPEAAVFIIVTLLATYFISSDRKEIRKFIYKQLPDKWVKNIAGIKVDTITAVFGYFKAVLILMLVTFIEATVGFYIIGVDYALVMGLVVAICEVIPIFGTGLIMLPWIAWCLLTGDITLAFWLAIVYILGILIRQIIEPKILSDQIGLHPLVTLVSMYMGLSLFGVVGMIIGPISIIIIRNLQVSGLIKIWRE